MQVETLKSQHLARNKEKLKKRKKKKVKRHLLNNTIDKREDNRRERGFDNMKNDYSFENINNGKL